MDVGVFIVDDAADFGLAAVLEILGTANALREDVPHPPPPWTVTTLGIGTQIRSGAGHIVPTTPLASLSGLPDLLIVPAVNTKQAPALIELVSSPRNRPVRELISLARSENVPLAAACTGTFFLAEAGVLDGCTATTSWWLAPVFRRRYQRVTLDETQKLCRGPGVTTAGAALSHIDLALALVHDHSRDLAELVARYLLIGNNLPQAAFAISAIMAQYDPLTAAFERWVRSHLDEPIQITAAAQALGISERSLQRTTAATLGMTPMDLVHEIRLDHATHLLRSTNLSVDTVASRVGYLNARTLRDLIRRRRATTVRDLRRRTAPHPDAASPPPADDGD